MSYLSILVPFKDNEKCRKVTLNFNYKGQITVYTSQTTDHPYVGNAEFDCISFNFIFLSLNEMG